MWAQEGMLPPFQGQDNSTHGAPGTACTSPSSYWAAQPDGSLCNPPEYAFPQTRMSWHGPSQCAAGGDAGHAALTRHQSTKNLGQGQRGCPHAVLRPAVHGAAIALLLIRRAASCTSLLRARVIAEDGAELHDHIKELRGRHRLFRRALVGNGVLQAKNPPPYCCSRGVSWSGIPR